MDVLIAAEIPHAGHFISAGRKDFGAVVGPADVEHGTAGRLLRFRNRLAVLLDLPTSHVVVPTSRHQEGLFDARRERGEDEEYTMVQNRIKQQK